VAYAFLANSRVTKNRPPDEHRFQIKYSGKRDGELHEIWQDPWELYTTLFLGINVEEGFWVAADPVLHDPTRFFISLEFKQADADRVLVKGWHSWERSKQMRQARGPTTDWIEVLAGGTAESFLRLIRFERAGKGLDPGHRQLLAEKLGAGHDLQLPAAQTVERALHRIERPPSHPLIDELELGPDEIMDLIESAPRLKMAVRGWVAEEHLVRRLGEVPGVEDCVRLEGEGQPDVRLRYRGSRPLEIECKNVLRSRLADGTIRVDFQKTRASKGDPCSRFYATEDFDLVAACMHSCTEEWGFRYALTRELDVHKKCPEKLSNLVRIDERWILDVEIALHNALEIA
jgi:hypothetical protein